MQPSGLLALLSAVTAATAVSVSYDTTYDAPSTPLTGVTCSDGENGLITRFGWDTLGQIPNFPLVGGAEAVEGHNSPNCGTCWSLTYNGNTINVLAVDVATSGFNIALEALDDLTNNQGEALGRVEAEAVEVRPSECGL